VVSDGVLSGAQIDGKVATESLSEKGTIYERLAAKLASEFYVRCVESASPDSFSVKLWAKLSKTVFKNKLEEFFDRETDFSKRLLSWKANYKFEDVKRGSTLRQFVTSLKTEYGINYVFFWHALSGYWVR
jgi:hypothetical protein